MRCALTTLTRRVAPVAAIVSSIRCMEQMAIVFGGIVIWHGARFLATAERQAYGGIRGAGQCRP